MGHFVFATLWLVSELPKGPNSRPDTSLRHPSKRGMTAGGPKATATIRQSALADLRNPGSSDGASTVAKTCRASAGPKLDANGQQISPELVAISETALAGVRGAGLPVRPIASRSYVPLDTPVAL